MNEKLVKIIADQLGVDAAECKPEARLLEDLGADSLDVVELIMAVEEEFGLEIPDEDAENLATVGAIEAYLAQKVQG